MRRLELCLWLVACALLAALLWVRLRGPELVNRSDIFRGYEVYLDGRIRVLQAGEWGMGWTIRPGDYVLWVPLEGSPQVGDVVLYQDNGLVAQRVVSLENGVWVRGDNSEETRLVQPVGIVIGVVYSR